MNFLAHSVVADRYAPPAPLARPAYAVGTALPDLIGLAAARARLRPAPLAQAPSASEDDVALRMGAVTHLAADTAFHKAPAFAGAQAEVGLLLDAAGFEGIRVRRFFVAHVLAELALDAALLRADPELGARFYADWARADFARAARWAEDVTHLPLPDLPGVLARFAASQYLLSYATDGGVAAGLARLCRRARQDTFEGGNFDRLVSLAGRAVALLAARADVLLAQTLAALPPPE